jgi:hypothetical protein
MIFFVESVVLFFIGEKFFTIYPFFLLKFIPDILVHQSKKVQKSTSPMFYFFRRTVALPKLPCCNQADHEYPGE